MLTDLELKIVILSGPRQVGKTTVSKNLMSQFQYLNYDSTKDRKVIAAESWNRETDLVIFDEIHKKKNWKSWIKGLFDVEGVRPRLLVTGSARMDTYKKGGDSLAGRHFQFRLNPFTVSELKNDFDSSECLERLLKFGGFPEPFLKNEEIFANRWRQNHLERILKIDLLELELVRNLKTMELLVDLLAERVGSTISYNNLARDLEISPHTVKKWISILESLYVIFVVYPYTKKLSRVLLKEPKIYFYDTGRVKDEIGARLENTVALAILSKLQFNQDVLGEKSNLFYVRDKEKREVDFVIEKKGKISELIEVKTSDSSLSSHLKYFAERLNPAKSFQVVLNLPRQLSHGNIKIVRAHDWLREL